MIYVHVPFCRSFCTYCDFYSELTQGCRNVEDTVEYADALCAEIRGRKDEIKRVFTSSGVSTLYVGGGTPSVLPLSFFETLLGQLKKIGVEGPFREFTVEVNPEDVVQKGQEYIKGLLDLGVNRISMGVQSFDDDILRFMNRRHSSSQAVQAYRVLEEAGVSNISIDLIFGLPQLSDELWRGTLTKALEISSYGILPHHISSYQLSVEPGSALSKLVDKGLWKEASQEKCARQYEILCETMAEAGYRHYEISNFALPGYEAVHNSAYWKHIPYVGLGPGAHSFLDVSQEGGSVYMRRWNYEDLRSYILAGKNSDFSKVVGGESLDADQMVTETVMLGLRTEEGISEEYIQGHCDLKALRRALDEGSLIRLHNGNLRIPESRFFISDNIISDII